MSRTKVVKKSINPIKDALGKEAGDIGSFFNQLTGEEEADVKIIGPKYIKLRTNVSNAAIVMDMLTRDEVANEMPEKKSWLMDLNKFANTLMSESKVQELKDENIPTDRIEMNKLYRGLKDSSHVKAFVTILKYLKPFDQFLKAEPPVDKWILDMPGFDFKPFVNFSEYDLKYIWTCDTVKPKTRDFIFKVVIKILSLAEATYKILISPDIDKEAFSGMLMASLDSMKSHIPRCDDAFRVIAESSNMLNDNFDDYYKSFVQTQDQTSMIQSFIIDVQKKQNKRSVKTTHQFRQIIQFIQKQSRGRPVHPKFKIVLDKLNSVYDMVDKKEAKHVPTEDDEKRPSQQDTNSESEHPLSQTQQSQSQQQQQEQSQNPQSEQQQPNQQQQQEREQAEKISKRKKRREKMKNKPGKPKSVLTPKKVAVEE